MGRTRFHEELELLELDVLGMGELSERAVGKSVGALIDHQDAQAHAVVAADDEIDEKYMSVRDLPTSQSIQAHIREMEDVVRPMIRTAMEAFRRRDLELCLRLPEMDDPVDRLNLGMYKEVAALAGDPELLNWGLRMILVARQLERVGDHSVDIAEQVGFLITGEFREFTDASHPVDITPDAG